MNLIQIIEKKHSKNGVVSLKQLRRDNYHLYKLIKSNLQEYKDRFYKECGIQILEDTYSVKSLEKIKLYILYNFGENVNLSTLRATHQQIYLNICKLGKPFEVLTSLGFKVIYNCKWRK